MTWLRKVLLAFVMAIKTRQKFSVSLSDATSRDASALVTLYAGYAVCTFCLGSPNHLSFLYFHFSRHLHQSTKALLKDVMTEVGMVA